MPRAPSNCCCRPALPRPRSGHGSAPRDGSASPMEPRASGSIGSPSPAADRSPAPLVPPRDARCGARMAPRDRLRPGGERQEARRPLACRGRRRQGPRRHRRPAGRRDPEYDDDRGSDRDGDRDRTPSRPDRIRPPVRCDTALPGRSPGDRSAGRRPSGATTGGATGRPAPRPPAERSVRRSRRAGRGPTSTSRPVRRPAGESAAVVDLRPTGSHSMTGPRSAGSCCAAPPSSSFR